MLYFEDDGAYCFAYVGWKVHLHVSLWQLVQPIYLKLYTFHIALQVIGQRLRSL